jgi:hypothetical protein
MIDRNAPFSVSRAFIVEEGEVAICNMRYVAMRKRKVDTGEPTSPEQSRTGGGTVRTCTRRRGSDNWEAGGEGLELWYGARSRHPMSTRYRLEIHEGGKASWRR